MVAIIKSVMLVLACMANPCSQWSVPFMATVKEAQKNPIANQYIVLMVDQPKKILSFQNTGNGEYGQSYFGDIKGLHLLDKFDFPAISDEYSAEDHINANDQLPAGIDQPLKGFIARITERETLEILRRRSEVLYIEQDQRVFVSESINDLGITQRNATWGLQRISQHEKLKPSRGPYQYSYPKSAGEGVDVYVIDTGINIDHRDFGGRAIWGVTIPQNDRDIDGNGHGSHTAATIVGTRFGVAKRAKAIAVKVLGTDGSGTMSDVLKGVEWVLKQHKSATGKKSVANMSLGGGKSLVLDRAVNTAVASGVHFAVAAGNSFDDACDYSPAGAGSPITVGASDINDQMATFSNYGPCIDIFAPGKDIPSVWIGSVHAERTISGTSMASPHVAGAIAVALGDSKENPSSKDMKKLLGKRSTKNALSGIQGKTKNQLLFS